MDFKLPKDPLESGKWVQLRLKKLADGTYRLERADLERADKRARDFASMPMTGFRERFVGMCAELVGNFALTEEKVLYEWKEMHEQPGRADFTVRCKHGDVDIEIKSSPHYGDYIILREDKADFDYVVGIKLLSVKRAEICGYLPVQDALSYPVLQDWEHKALRVGLGPGRPIPLSGLRPIGELWELLRAP